MGLLKPELWKAHWIRGDWEEDPDNSQPAHLLRKEFKLNSNIQSARAYVSALGLYEA